jgi:hypothetical protein
MNPTHHSNKENLMDNLDTPVAAIATSTLVKEVGRVFAINAAAYIGAGAGLGLVLFVGGKFMERKDKKDAKKLDAEEATE